MNKYSNFLRAFFLCGIVTIGVAIGLSLPASADTTSSCMGSCDQEPWGPGGEPIEFCNFNYPACNCSGNDGGPCGGCIIELE